MADTRHAMDADWLMSACLFIPVHDRFPLIAVNSFFRTAVVDNPFFKQDLQKAEAAIMLRNCFVTLQEGGLKRRAAALTERLRERRAQRALQMLQERMEARRAQQEGFVAAIQMVRRRRLLRMGLNQFSTSHQREKLLTSALQALKNYANRDREADSSESRGSCRSSMVDVLS